MKIAGNRSGCRLFNRGATASLHLEKLVVYLKREDNKMKTLRLFVPVVFAVILVVGLMTSCAPSLTYTEETHEAQIESLSYQSSYTTYVYFYNSTTKTMMPIIQYHPPEYLVELKLEEGTIFTLDDQELFEQSAKGDCLEVLFNVGRDTNGDVQDWDIIMYSRKE
jgi:hypothetical protein